MTEVHLRTFAGMALLLMVLATALRALLPPRAQPESPDGPQTSDGNGAVSEKLDFALSLPAADDISEVVAHLQRLAGSLDLTISAISIESHAPRVASIGRTELGVQIRGRYTQVSVVLAQALSRFPGLIIRRLSLQRIRDSGEIEAQIELVLLSRPITPVAESR